HRRLSRCAARPSHLVRSDGRDCGHRGARAVARLGVGAGGMSEVKVLIADKMDSRAAAIFLERGISVDEKPGLSPDELAAIIGGYDGLARRSSPKGTPAG